MDASAPRVRKSGARTAAGTEPRKSPASVDKIYGSVMQAVMDRRLPPNTRLPEESLATAFGVGRTRVRSALKRLEAAQIVTIRPKKGATVACPTANDAHMVFQARRALECGITRLLIDKSDNAFVARLRDLIQLEAAARETADVPEVLRASGRFHVAMAESTDNPLIADILKALISRTSLILTVFVPSIRHLCDAQDHSRILDAIEAKQRERAPQLMEEHLRHLEGSITPLEKATAEIDIAAILQPANT
jgi:DNA-binding GntR family transcriptional regulator